MWDEHKLTYVEGTNKEMRHFEALVRLEDHLKALKDNAPAFD